MRKKRVLIIGILLSAILFYGTLLAFLYFNQQRLLYFPDKQIPSLEDWNATNAEIIHVKTKDGLDLSGWYFPPEDRKMKTIVYFHGNAQNHASRVSKISDYVEKGYGVLLAGYRGYGGNPGNPDEQGLYLDARSYLDFLIDEKHMPENSIVLYGESLGTGVAIQMATEYRVGGLVLEAPYSSIFEIAKAMYYYVPVDLLLKDRFLSIEQIGRISAPSLFLHGEKDRTIPVRFGRKLFEAAPEPKKMVVIPEAGHNDLYEHGAALHILDFLSNIPRASGSER